MKRGWGGLGMGLLIFFLEVMDEKFCNYMMVMILQSCIYQNPVNYTLQKGNFYSTKLYDQSVLINTGVLLSLGPLKGQH
jgi:hypothetical protein